jgi:hypothetical protein
VSDDTRVAVLLIEEIACGGSKANPSEVLVRSVQNNSLDNNHGISLFTTLMLHST